MKPLKLWSLNLTESELIPLLKTFVLTENFSSLPLKSKSTSVELSCSILLWLRELLMALKVSKMSSIDVELSSE